MIEGKITCECGGYFSFLSILDTINCPYCQKQHITCEHGEEIIDPDLEEVVDE